MGYRRIDPATVIALGCYLFALKLIGNRLCRDEDDSFDTYFGLFTFLPFIGGYAVSPMDSVIISFITAAFLSLPLTLNFGNLSLKTCLLLSPITGATFIITTHLGLIAEAVLIRALIGD